MARECTICGKKAGTTTDLIKLRGKYNPTSKRKRYPNLQWVRIPIDTKRKNLKAFAGKRIRACTKCIKSIAKTN